MEVPKHWILSLGMLQGSCPAKWWRVRTDGRGLRQERTKYKWMLRLGGDRVNRGRGDLRLEKTNFRWGIPNDFE